MENTFENVEMIECKEQYVWDDQVGDHFVDICSIYQDDGKIFREILVEELIFYYKKYPLDPKEIMDVESRENHVFYHLKEGKTMNCILSEDILECVIKEKFFLEDFLDEFNEE